MTDKLPPNLLVLFQPRPGLRYLAPCDHAPEDRKSHNISGVAAYISQIEDYKSIPYEPTESWLSKKIQLKAEKAEKQAQINRDDFDECEQAWPVNIR